jgi:hypothetical protein
MKHVLMLLLGLSVVSCGTIRDPRSTHVIKILDGELGSTIPYIGSKIHGCGVYASGEPVPYNVEFVYKSNSCDVKVTQRPTITPSGEGIGNPDTIP